MFRLIAKTQYCENYGTEESPYWKFKGGTDYVVARLTTEQVVALGQAGLAKLVTDARGSYEWRNPMSESYLIDWELLAPGELTWFESAQLEQDGFIEFPARELEEAAA